jgi:hypothetical protein
MDVKEIVCDDVDWKNRPTVAPVAGFCVHESRTSDCIRDEFLGQLSDYLFVNYCSIE